MSTPLRVGLIGAGRIAAKHLRAFKDFPDRLKLEAVCDVNRTAAEAVAAEFRVDRIYTDYAQLLREAPIDAVDICTVHNHHAEQAMAAAAAGRHILLEKPMGVSMGECRAMVAAAQKAGVTFMIAQNQRYKANYRSVRRIIAEGELGPIRAIRTESQMNVTVGAGPDHWVFDGAQAGGGVIISLALHRIDLMRWFIGEVQRVSAVTRCTHPWFGNGAENWACAMLEFENGAIGEMFATYTPFRSPGGETFVVFGDSGTVHALPPVVLYNDPALVASATRTPEIASGDRARRPREGREPRDPDAPIDPKRLRRGFEPLPPDQQGLPTGDMFVDEVLHFADCCASGSEPLSSARDNLRTMQTVFAMYRSAELGRPVELSELGEDGEKA